MPAPVVKILRLGKQFCCEVTIESGISSIQVARGTGESESDARFSALVDFEALTNGAASLIRGDARQ